MSSVQTTVNVGTGCEKTPGPFAVRAFYAGPADAGHLFGPFATREAAEACATVLAGRGDVKSVAVEPAAA